MKLRNHTGVASRQRGFSLLEVLVAVLILSIGLLGLAGLQTTSLQMNHSAHYASQAQFYAQEIIEAMRANPTAAKQGAYNIGMGSDVPGGSSVADQDLRRWRQGISTTLPMQGDETGGSVQLATSADTYRITVRVAWLDARWEEDDGDRIRTMTVRADL